MSIITDQVCPHCEKRNLVVEHDDAADVPNGPRSLHSPEGYVVRCSGASTGACDSPDVTGKCKSVEEAVTCATETIGDWKYSLVA